MSPAEENHASSRTMPSSPAEEKHPSSLPSPEAATTEALKMSDEHPSSCTMLPVAATPEKIDDTTELNITVDFDNRSSKKKKSESGVLEPSPLCCRRIARTRWWEEKSNGGRGRKDRESEGSGSWLCCRGG